MGASLREWTTPTAAGGFLTKAAADLLYTQGPGQFNTLGDARYLRLIGGALTGLLDLSSATAGQIKFPSPANVSANANTLDAYEEGTWTPTMTATSGGTITMNAPSTFGKYVRIGTAVHVWGRLLVSAISAPLGFAQVNGLPFTIAGVATFAPVGPADGQNFTAGTITAVNARGTPTTSTLNINRFNAGQLTAAANSFAVGTDCSFYLCYTLF